MIFLTDGKANSDNYRFSGASLINYIYAIKDNLMLGVEAAYERIKRDLFVGKTKVAEQTDNALIIGAHAWYSYIANAKFRMYSGLAAGYVTVQGTSKLEGGISYKASKGNTGRFGYHLAGFDFLYGKKATVVAELGFGYKGILNVGFNYRFYRKKFKFKMGKGDKKTRRGKIVKKSYDVRRPKVTKKRKLSAQKQAQ